MIYPDKTPVVDQAQAQDYWVAEARPIPEGLERIWTSPNRRRIALGHVAMQKSGFDDVPPTINEYL